MSGAASPLSGPDLRAGIPSTQLPEGGSLLGRVDGAAVLLIRQGGVAAALAATCTHWGGPLAEGLIVRGTVRCPWHHACFDARTGAVLGGPAMDPLARWKVEERDGIVRVAGPLEPQASARRLDPRAKTPDTLVIVGAGGAGTVAAAEARRLGFSRRLIVIDPDPDASVDRPNLSKDYLAGKADEAWIPLRPADWWAERDIERRQTGVLAIRPRDQHVTLANGATLDYDALILATGAEPVRLPLPGDDGPPVQTLRTLADARRIVAAAQAAKRVAVLGASFIGLEVAASLRDRGVEVHVVAPEARPLERILGPEVGDFVRTLHQEHGVHFHLERTAAGRRPGGLTLSDGTFLAADLVVLGVGVRPRIELAERAGLEVDKGVIVNQRLETSAPGIFAAGDIARYPEPLSGAPARIEHWVVAHRQGRTAARNALGLGEAYTDVPFFWSQHYDVPIAYVGYAPTWDAIELDGSFASRDVTVRYRQGGTVRAMASVFRDAASLEFEARLEQSRPEPGQ
jgi:NADPH-dependent 2,4-dienoyl-CoA reductase/sulfur reductase-like enzyme/nitrite reductase/ring-hydroxylating ferredoxin subunit